MPRNRPTIADTLRALRGAFERHQHLMPALLDNDASAIDHFSWSEDAFRGLFYGIASDSLRHGASLSCPPLPGASDSSPVDHRNWQPIRQVARSRPEWIIELLQAPGLRTRFPRASLQLLESLQLTRGRQTPRVKEFLRQVLHRQIRVSRAWREQALVLLIHHRPVDTLEILHHLKRQDPAPRVRAMAQRYLDDLAVEPQPITVEIRDALHQFLGAPDTWLESPGLNHTRY